MSIKNKIINTLVEVFWPWFIEHIWPKLQKYIIEIILLALASLAKKAKDAFSENAKKRAKEAEDKATEAEKNASECNSKDSEYDVYKAQAEVWRTIAKQYEKDLEELKQQVSDIENHSKAEVARNITDTMPKMDISEESPSLSVGDVSHKIPKI